MELFLAESGKFFTLRDLSMVMGTTKSHIAAELQREYEHGVDITDIPFPDCERDDPTERIEDWRYWLFPFRDQEIGEEAVIPAICFARRAGRKLVGEVALYENFDNLPNNLDEDEQRR
jgi:hypothetical protein